MSLLSRLREAREKRFGRAATATDAIPATQPKGESAIVAKIATVAVAAPTDAKTADAVTSWRWLVHFADADPQEVHCSPAATHAGILERYPDALAAEPLPARDRREASDGEAEELARLVLVCGEHYGFTRAEHADALAAALADPVDALACFRAIALRTGNDHA